MYRAIAVATALLATTAATAAMAAEQARAKPPLPTCTPSGYAPPVYGTFGANGGGGQFAYVIGSPCTPQQVKDADEAIGMGRMIPMALTGVTTTIWSATGTMANAKGQMDKIDKLDVQSNYFIPAIRVAETVGGGKPMIQVYADGKTWSEETQGTGAKPLPAAAGDTLFALLKMTPFGGLWSATEAEGHVKVATVAGKTVFTGTSPYDGVEVTTVMGPPGNVVGLKANLSTPTTGLPESVSFTLRGHKYMGSFSDYRFSWESDYRVVFPAHIVWTRDGKPLADLNVTYFHSNPYVVFPIPDAATPVPSTIMAKAAPVPAGGYIPPAKRLDYSAGFAAMMEARVANAQTPRTPDGHPDFTGQWGGGFTTPYGDYDNRHLGTFEPDQADQQRSTHLNKPVYKPEFWDKVRSLDYSKVDVDPVYNCGPTGVPRQMAPAKIMQNAKEILLTNGDSNRFVPLDGRKFNDDDSDQSTFDGVPIGHWEGDTLVVESIGFNDISWLMWQGYFHTDQMKVTEHIWRKGNLMFYNATVDDPGVLAKPWTTDTVVHQLVTNPNARMAEREPCHEMDLNSLADIYNRG